VDFFQISIKHPYFSQCRIRRKEEGGEQFCIGTPPPPPPPSMMSVSPPKYCYVTVKRWIKLLSAKYKSLPTFEAESDHITENVQIVYQS